MRRTKESLADDFDVVSRDDTIDMLRSVVEGVRVAHVWRSPKYEGADMTMQFRWPEVEIDPDRDHGLPTDFAKEVELEYAGVLSRESAAEKLVNMRVAAEMIQG